MLRQHRGVPTMREIKFRAWDRTKEAWIYFNAGELAFWRDDTPYYEYTGNKDRRGREIYEKDLVRNEYFNDGEPLGVKFGQLEGDEGNYLCWYVEGQSALCSL